MSRIGNKLIHIPEGLTVTVGDGLVDIKGKFGEDKIAFDTEFIGVELNEGILRVTRVNDEKNVKAMHGTIRALINNACVGCHEGYTKKLAIIGIGYRAEMKGKDIVLHVGYSHPITISPMDGVTIKVVESKSKDVNAYVEISGSDKFKVGQVAAQIREIRKPEPYQGKGIRYVGEVVLRKEGKRAGKK